MKKICYTCITGGYDDLLPVEYKTEGWTYIAFVTSDVKISNNNGWDSIVIIDPEHYNLRKLSSKKIARYYKHRPLEVLSPFLDTIVTTSKTIWVDGRVSIQCDLDQFGNMLDDGYDLISLDHPERDCAYQEIGTCSKMEKEHPVILSAIRRKYIQDKYPEHNGMIQSGVLIRRLSATLIAFQNKWWEEIKQNSIRDQISFNYLLWKWGGRLGFKTKTIPTNKYLDKGYLELMGHKNPQLPSIHYKWLNED